MKLTRRGYYKNYGTDVLIEEDTIKRKLDKWNNLKWDVKTREISFQCRGSDRGSNYPYHLSFTVAELMAFLQSAIPTLAPETPSRAVCLGAIATLQELLSPLQPVDK